MRKFYFSVRSICLFALTLTFYLVTHTACSTENDPDDDNSPPPIDNGNNGNGNEDDGNEGNENPSDHNSLQLILTELEKHESLSLFTKALQAADLSETDGPFTVLAVENSAFEEDDSPENMTSQILRHILTGSYTPEELIKESEIKSAEGGLVKIDFASLNQDGEEEWLVYANHILISLPSCISVEGNKIYTTDAFLPATTELPAESDSDFFKALGRKIEGEWRIIEYKLFETIHYDANTSTTEDITPSNIHTNCFEVFHWKPGAGAFGTYTLVHSGEHDGTGIGAVGSNRRRENGGVWMVSNSSKEDTIATLDFGFLWGNSSRTNVHFYLDREIGVGTQMKYIVNYPGYSLYPPNQFPSCITYETILLQKTKNKP